MRILSVFVAVHGVEAFDKFTMVAVNLVNQKLHIHLESDLRNRGIGPPSGLCERLIPRGLC